jgi:hypothetical protein
MLHVMIRNIDSEPIGKSVLLMPAGMFLNLLEIREMGAANFCTHLFLFSVLKFKLH